MPGGTGWPGLAVDLAVDVLVARFEDGRRLGLCSDVLVRPAALAQHFATLDELSGGRAVLGLGAGISGFSEMRLERLRPARAVAETAALVNQLLTGEQVDFRGVVFSFEGKLDFAPPRPAVSVYVAAGGPRMLERAGEFADGVIIEGCMSPPVLEAAIENVKRGALRVHRDATAIALVARIDTSIDESLERAYEVLRPRVARHLANAAPGFERFTARGLDVSTELRELASGIGYTHDPAVLAPLAARVTPEMIDSFCLAATPATLDAKIAPLLERGVTQLLINPVAPDDRLEPIIDAVAAWRAATFAERD
jgi:5,10-methylenetetrahydromethanopterin reductase